MTKSTNQPIDAAALRVYAEQRWAESRLGADLAEVAANSKKLLQELQIHQFELEMQNAELRQSRQEAETSLARFTEFFDFSPSNYLTLSPDGSIVEANLTFANFVGREWAQLIGRRFGVFVAAESLLAFNQFLAKTFAGHAKACAELTLDVFGKPPLFAHIEAIADKGGRICRMVMTDITGFRQADSGAAATGRFVQLEPVALRDDETESDVAVSAAPIHDPDEEAPEAPEVIRSFAVRRLSERLLIAFENRFHTALNALQEGVVLHDQNGVIDFCNASGQRILGLTMAQLSGLANSDPSWQTIHEDGSNFPSETYPVTISLREGIAQHDVVMGIYKPSGELVWASINSVPLGPVTKPAGVVVTAVDITERKRLEHTLQATAVELQKAKVVAEEANLAKSDFLASMSHELRSPLNAVLGFAQLMESGTPAPSVTQKRSIDQILKAGWHLLNLINEILDLSTIESGKVAMSQESMSLSEVLRDCNAMVSDQALQRGLAMTFPNFEQPFYVHADRTRVKQVMINLLSNAIKYNRVDGSVVVECVMAGENRVRVSVTNTGAGLMPEQVAQLFQPFNRLGQETGCEQGTGIGLVVTKKLVELMGGTIGGESRVGVSSVFWVEFPATTAPKLAVGDSSELSTDQLQWAPTLEVSQRTLLYVEDNPANLLLVEELIARRVDLKLLTATDAELGIKMAIGCRPDVILMDINLPGMNGFGALKILSQEPATARIPVLALSASALPLDILKGANAGFFGYLTKPIKVKEFMKAVDVALLYAAENGVASHGEDVNI